MILPVFNLANEIKLYNDNADMKFKETEDFDCAFLESKMLTDTNATIRLINKGFTQRLLSEEEKVYLQKRNNYVKALKELCLRQKERPAGVIVPDYEQAIGVKYYNYIWLHLQQQAFVKEENWQQWLNVSADRAKKDTLLHLKTSWMQHQAFSRHDNEAIHQIAFDLLPSLIEYHELALDKLHWSKLWMPSSIYEAYRDYLKLFIIIAKKRQLELAHSMYRRLTAWDNNYNNVTTHFISQLEQHNVALTHIYKPLPKVKDELNTKHFTAFHAYIDQHGDKQLKAKLKTLSWCRTDKKLIPTANLSFSTGLTIVPQALVKQIPKKRRSPAWLHIVGNIT